MRNYLLIILCTAILFSCKGKDRVPNGILPPRKMQAVMWDMLRSDQFLADFVLNKDTNLNVLASRSNLYERVLMIHDLDQQSFKKNYLYYQQHPSLMREIMDSITRMSFVQKGTVSQEPQIATDTSVINQPPHPGVDPITPPPPPTNDTTRRKGSKKAIPLN